MRLRRLGRRAWSGHARSAVWTAIIVTLSSVAMYAIVLAAAPTAWPLAQGLAPGMSPDRALAVGQVFTGFLAIFLGTLFGVFAFREFSQAQEKPDLRLRFLMTDTGDLVTQTTSAGQVVAEPGQEAPLRAFLAVENVGTVSSNWFMVQCSLPFVESLTAGPFGRAVKSLAGGEENWRWFKAPNGPVRFTFLSNGSFGVFPGWPLILAELMRPVREVMVDEHYRLPYTIATDRTPPTHGELVLVFRPAQGSAR
jgi:hypothetical protein